MPGEGTEERNCYFIQCSQQRSLTCRQRPEKNRDECFGVWGNSFPTRGDGKGKGHEAGTHLMCLRSTKEANVVIAE